MTNRWAQVTELFDAVLALPADAREAFLATQCEGDAALLAELKSLIHHHTESEGFLEGPESNLAGLTDAPAAAPGAGAVIGVWRLLEPLGEGGMGTVWLAERVTGEFHQRAALKLIRFGMAFEEAIRRFERERQILASLEHPNIARLVDGGSTPDGLPYLVMELVEGEPLYAYCSARSLSIAERLRMFVTLCSAVHYAHQKLVVHRDLKPGNVMITARGEPKLLDFGVAKIFEDKAGVGLLTVAAPFTPLYASPEQLRGEPATTASDVYSLGVLLYELMTGVHPYPTRTGSAADVVRAVLDVDPRRPSTAVTSPPSDPESRGTTLPAPPMDDRLALMRRLSGDLDNIVLMAMAKDPARRYASVERLAADVQRHLEGRPVEARGDSWSYRAAKFAARNRLAVAAGVLAVLALIGAFAVSLHETSVARRERALAEQRLRDVQSLANTLMFDVYDGIENMPGATAVRGDVIRKVAGYLDALALQAGRDSSMRFSLADAYERLGIAQSADDIGPDGGIAQALKSYERSRTLREDLLREYRDNAHALNGLVQTYTRIGAAYEMTQRWPEALEMMQLAKTIQERLVKLHPADEGYAAGLPRRQNNLGLALLYNHRPQEAMVELREAARGYTALAAADTANWQQRRLLAMSLTLSGDAFLQQGASADSAERVERRALELYEDLLRRRPEDLDLELRVADGHERLAQILVLRGGFDQGLVEAEAAQRMIEAVAASDPTNRDMAFDAAGGRALHGLMCAQAGRYDSAERLLRSAAASLERYAREDSTDARLTASMPNLRLGQALVAVARARASGKAPSWFAARSSIMNARHLFAADASNPSPPAVLSDDQRWIERGLAACDSALIALGR
jgi:eukaryotic-like serine/threonine-protein kinase